MSILYTRFDPVFFEKTRLSIITVLYQEKKVSFNRLKKILSQSDGAVYSHLKKLNEAGYIESKKEISPENAVQTIYNLSKKGVKAFTEYLQFMQDLLKERSESNE